jgi:hypothetical protein
MNPLTLFKRRPHLTAAGSRRRRFDLRLALAAATAALLLGPAWNDAHAGRQAPGADLEVRLTGPAAAGVNLPESYSVTVTNLGRDRSGSITASVTFPLTNTSPQVFILGAVRPMDSRCRMVGNTLSCALADLRKDWSTSFRFEYTAPVSTRPLLITASARSSTPDPVPNNNSSSTVPNLVHPALPISASSATVRSCTGSALTAFTECTYFPSSISSFPLFLRSDRSIDLFQPGYSGIWSQNTASTSLKMEFFEDQGLGQGPVRVAEFNGWAINGARCFHGLTTFPQNATYVSAYEVCLP